MAGPVSDERAESEASRHNDEADLVEPWEVRYRADHVEPFCLHACTLLSTEADVRPSLLCRRTK